MSTPAANNLVNERSGSQFSDAILVNRTVALLDARFAESWSVSKLSAAVGTNRTRLQRAFRFTTGMTIHSYLTNKRIGEAVKLLRDRSIKVSVVYLMVGYRSRSHFSIHFKHLTGRLPRQI